MNISKYSNKELKIRKQVIKYLNINQNNVKDIFKQLNITIIGIS